jgi:hypothetical protein
VNSLGNTTPIENVVDPRAFAREYMAFSRYLGHPRNLIELHKAKLGRQTTTFQVAEHRLWVWVRPTWTVFVSNAKGICFEVPEGMTSRAAWKAWRDYMRALW